MIACRHLLGWLLSAFRSRQDLILENLALRQQLLALHAQRPRRRLTTAHKLFWVGMRKVWARWKQPLILVTPRTVVNWHRAGFRLYWKWISRAQPKRGATGAETSRPREALADVPAESSGGDRGHGLFHRAHADLRHSVVLLHH